MADPEQTLTALRQAIIDHAEASGLNHEDDLLNEFIIVCHWQRLEADGKSRYTQMFHQIDDVPRHVAVGLCRIAEKWNVDDLETEDG